MIKPVSLEPSTRTAFLSALPSGRIKINENPMRKAQKRVAKASAPKTAGCLSLSRVAFRFCASRAGVSLSHRPPKTPYRPPSGAAGFPTIEFFVEMLKARNKMSHEYDEAEAQKVFKQIKKRFLKPIKTLLDRLENLA